MDYAHLTYTMRPLNPERAKLALEQNELRAFQMYQSWRKIRSRLLKVNLWIKSRHFGLRGGYGAAPMTKRAPLC